MYLRIITAAKVSVPPGGGLYNPLGYRQYIKGMNVFRIERRYKILPISGEPVYAKKKIIKLPP